MKRLLFTLALLAVFSLSVWADPISINVTSWNFQGCDTEFCDNRASLQVIGTNGLQINISGFWNGTGNGQFVGSRFLVNTIQFISPNLNFAGFAVGRFLLDGTNLISSSLPINPPEPSTSLIRIFDAAGQQVAYSLSMILPGDFLLTFNPSTPGNPGNRGNTITASGTSGQGVLNIGNGPASEVPEPMTLLLLGSGLAGLAAVRRRNRQ